MVVAGAVASGVASAVDAGVVVVVAVEETVADSEEAVVALGVAEVGVEALVVVVEGPSGDKRRDLTNWLRCHSFRILSIPSSDFLALYNTRFTRLTTSNVLGIHICTCLQDLLFLLFFVFVPKVLLYRDSWIV